MATVAQLVEPSVVVRVVVGSSPIRRPIPLSNHVPFKSGPFESGAVSECPVFRAASWGYAPAEEKAKGRGGGMALENVGTRPDQAPRGMA